jgi:hypothetical protein
LPVFLEENWKAARDELQAIANSGRQLVSAA